MSGGRTSQPDSDQPGPPLAGPREIALAAQRLRDGHLVAFPTETVYGLGADAMNPIAVQRVFEAKGRPSHNPLIVHVQSADALARIPGLISAWPARAAILAARFWPGPLTLVVPRGPAVPSIVTGGGDTVALRSPNHPIAQALLQAFGGPLVGPSANKSGHVSPTTAAHVRDEFITDGIVPLTILDGGPCTIGIESTVVHVPADSAQPLTILRPGIITAADLAAALNEPISEREPSNQPITDHTTTPDRPSPLPSPGLLASHYAPRTPVELTHAGTATTRAANLAAQGHSVVILALTKLTNTPQPPSRPPSTPSAIIIPMPPDPHAYAARLYAALREADTLARNIILVELPNPASPRGQTDHTWTAILDRLARAAAPRP